MTSSNPAPPDPASRHAIWRALLLVALPFVLYLPCYRGEFAVDDHRFIAQNAANLERVLRAPWQAFSDPATNAPGGDGDIYRPIRTLSFAVDHALFGANPLGYHLHNLALHALCALLAWRLLRGAVGERLGFAAALLFVMHPLATEATAWISGRSDLEAAAAVLGALLLARRAESHRAALTWTVLLAAAAGFAKETAVMAPLLYLVEHRLRTGRLGRAALAPSLAIGAGVVLYLGVYLFGIDRAIQGQVGWYGGSFASHLPYGVVGLARMLRMTVVPSGFHYLHEPHLYAPLAPTTVAMAIVGLIAVAAAAVATRRRQPAIGLGVLWFAAAIVPAANIALPLRTVLAERFAYLPLVGACLAICAAYFVLAARLRRPTAILITAAALTVCAGVTMSRASDWSTREALHRASLRSWPSSYAARIGLASALEEAGDRGAAMEQFAIAADLPVERAPRADALYGLGHVAMLAGELDRANRALAEVDRWLTEDETLARRMKADAAEARYDLGCTLALLHRPDLAGPVFDRLIAQHGETAERLDARGEIERAKLNAALAVTYYERALRLDPDYHPARLHLAEMLKEVPGFESEAKRAAREVLARDPGNERAARVLAEIERVEQERRALIRELGG